VFWIPAQQKSEWLLKGKSRLIGELPLWRNSRRKLRLNMLAWLSGLTNRTQHKPLSSGYGSVNGLLR